MRYDLIKNHLGEYCTVLTKDNRFLFLGRITEFDEVERKIRLENYKGDQMSWQCVLWGARIKIHIKAEKPQNRLIVIEGTVLRSAADHLILGLDFMFVKREKRQCFRQNVRKRTVLSRVNGKKPESATACMILDISATGLALQCEQDYQIGDQLSLYGQQLREGGPSHNFDCVVVRKKALEKDGYLYGCRLLNLSIDEEDALFSDIFALQAAELHDDHG